MTIWRSQAVEATIGGTLDSSGLTRATIESLVANQVPEGPQVEFKGRTYQKNVDAKPKLLTPEQEFAKDVAAMANHQGGVLFIGVNERAGIAYEVEPLTHITAEREESRLRFALANYLAPLAPVEFLPVLFPNQGFVLVVIIPPSLRSPHAVLKAEKEDGTKPLRYPVRHGTDSRWLEEFEVAERYVRRLRADQLGTARLEGVIEAGCDALRRSEGLWVGIAIIPEWPALDRIDRSAVAATKVWLDGQSVWSPLNQNPFIDLQVMAAPGRTYADRRGPDGTISAPQEVHAELHADGSAFLAMELRLLSGGAVPEKIRAVDAVMLTCDVIPLIELGQRWVACQAAVPGIASVAALLCEPGRAGGHLGAPVELYSRGAFGRGVKVPDSRRLVAVKPKIQIVCDLTRPVTTQGAVATASVVLDGLLQWFGQGGTPFINPDGSVQIQAWPPAVEKEARRWAVDFDVPLVEG